METLSVSLYLSPTNIELFSAATTLALLVYELEVFNCRLILKMRRIIVVDLPMTGFMSISPHYPMPGTIV